MAESIPMVDIVGVGLNATDTVIRLPHFPAFNSKVEFRISDVLPGGQVASAMVACSKWGLKARYVGKIGDDPIGLLQKRAMESAGVEAHWVVAGNCQSPSSFILVDEGTGERTVLWKRDPRLELFPAEVQKEWVEQAKLLHVDGHDCSAATAAARWAREAHIPVTADIDNRYPGVEVLLENVDYAITSREFPARITGEENLFVSLPRMASRFGCRLVGATLGADGVLVWDRVKFQYAPAFDVKPVDTTGAGDIFHAAFAFSLLRGDALPQILQFSCAAAGLACLKLGARGGIATLEEVEAMVRSGARRPGRLFQGTADCGRCGDMIPLRVDILRTRVAICNGFLIIVNFVAFFYELSLPAKAGNALVYTFGLVPSHTQLLFAGHGTDFSQVFAPYVTSMFLHGGWMHILGNMLFLWVFGGSVEETLGHIQYLIFYFVCGIGSAIVHTIFNWGSKVPTIGASGAISGVMGAFIVLYPRARVTTLIPALLLFFTVRIPAVLMLGYWFLLQFLSGVTSLGMADQGGVAWWAHVGGFILGAILVIGERPKLRRALA